MPDLRQGRTAGKPGDEKRSKESLIHLFPSFLREPGARHPSISPSPAFIMPRHQKTQGPPGISLKEMIFIGDALYVGGNDYPAEQAGVISIPVTDPDETKRVTQAIIACLADRNQKA